METTARPGDVGWPGEGHLWRAMDGQMRMIVPAAAFGQSDPVCRCPFMGPRIWPGPAESNQGAARRRRLPVGREARTLYDQAGSRDRESMRTR